MQSTREPNYMALYQGMVDHEQTEEMINKIEKGKHVFIDWKMRLQYIMKNRYMMTDRCDFALGQEDIFDEQLALAMAQNTPYLTTINDE